MPGTPPLRTRAFAQDSLLGLPLDHGVDVNGARGRLHATALQAALEIECCWFDAPPFVELSLPARPRRRRELDENGAGRTQFLLEKLPHHRRQRGRGECSALPCRLRRARAKRTR